MIARILKRQKLWEIRPANPESIPIRPAFEKNLHSRVEPFFDLEMQKTCVSNVAVAGLVVTTNVYILDAPYFSLNDEFLHASW